MRMYVGCVQDGAVIDASVNITKRMKRHGASGKPDGDLTDVITKPASITLKQGPVLLSRLQSDELVIGRGVSASRPSTSTDSDEGEDVARSSGESRAQEWLQQFLLKKTGGSTRHSDTATESPRAAGGEQPMSSDRKADVDVLTAPAAAPPSSIPSAAAAVSNPVVAVAAAVAELPTAPMLAPTAAAGSDTPAVTTSVAPLSGCVDGNPTAKGPGAPAVASAVAAQTPKLDGVTKLAPKAASVPASSTADSAAPVVVRRRIVAGPIEPSVAASSAPPASASTPAPAPITAQPVLKASTTAPRATVQPAAQGNAVDDDGSDEDDEEEEEDEDEDDSGDEEDDADDDGADMDNLEDDDGVDGLVHASVAGAHACTLHPGSHSSRSRGDGCAGRWATGSYNCRELQVEAMLSPTAAAEAVLAVRGPHCPVLHCNGLYPTICSRRAAVARG